ncbi:MAG: hypothetical protein ACK4UN_22090 [Limisphaerales bacterium]
MNPEATMGKIVLTLLLFLTAALTFGCGSLSKQTGADRVFWPDSRAYHKKAKSLPISEQEARRLLREAQTGALGGQLLLIVGDEYFFGDLDKTSVQMSGYYVHGKTGRIVYRRSNTHLRYGTRRASNIVFESEKLIRTTESGSPSEVN